MNSKGFHQFKKGVKGSNPMALVPILGFAALAYLFKDCIYYGTYSIILSGCWTLCYQIQ